MSSFSDRMLSRRRFVCSMVPAAAALCTEGPAMAQQAMPHVAESDPLAKSLGYVEDVKRVDPKSNPTFKPGAHCANCLQLQGKPGDAWRPCNLFAGRLVSSNGWCRVWVQNPKAA